MDLKVQLPTMMDSFDTADKILEDLANDAILRPAQTRSWSSQTLWIGVIGRN